jgi:hypothetical protein
VLKVILKLKQRLLGFIQQHQIFIRALESDGVFCLLRYWFACLRHAVDEDFDPQGRLHFHFDGFAWLHVLHRQGLFAVNVNCDDLEAHAIPKIDLKCYI